MEYCKHPMVQNFTFDDGKPAPLWGCTTCLRKFVPLDIAAENDAERYQAIRQLPDLIIVLRDVTANGISAEWPGAPGWKAIETATELDDAADALRASIE